MAVTAAQSLSSFSGYLSPEEAAPIFQRAARASVVQRLARQVPLGYRGSSIPIFGKVTAGWVDEGGQKPSSNMPVSIKSIVPKKLACLVPVSQEVVRANPGGFMQQVRVEVGNAFGAAFDLAALYDQGPDGTAAAGPFATNIGATSKSVELGTATTANGGVRADLISGLSLLLADGKRLNGFALDALMEPMLLGAVDTTGQPIYRELEINDLPDNELNGAVRKGNLLGRPSWMGEGIYSGATTDVYGVGGDWTQVAWGVVGGINFSISTEAAVTINGALVSAFENNLVIVRAEAEYGFVVADTAAFVKYLNAS